MQSSLTADEVIDAIAEIELERQEKAREAGNAPACAEALRKLQKLQTHEKDALREHGPSDVHSANLARLTAEIARVQKLGGATNRSSQPNRDNRGGQANRDARGGQPNRDNRGGGQPKARQRDARRGGGARGR